jgi:hypothetical protein
LFLTGFLSLALLAVPLHAHSLEFSDIAQEGQLRFLSVHPEPNTYRYESRVRVSEDSLVSGVVSIVTCHYQLDPIRKVVILFNPNRLQRIEVREASGIGGLEVEGHRVIMSDVKRGAMVCIDLQSKALDRIDESTYRLQAGPLMRRYFDGYLPMQATLRFEWPGHRVSLKQTYPEAQPGVKLMQDSDGAELDIIFAGRLLANIDLQIR